MNTQEQNKRPQQEQAANLSPEQGSDKNQPIKEPAAKADEERQAKPTS